MTVPSSVAKSGPYNCNGVTDVFNYDFRIVDKTHLNVILANAAGVETSLDLTTHYTVSDVGSDVGTINLTSAGVALAVTGTTLTILRNPPFTQETDLQNQGAYLAETVEDRFDLLTMQVQTVKERSDRSIAIPASDESTTLDDLQADLITVAAIAPAVSTVAANDADVSTVAGISADVTTVAGVAADIPTVADVASDIPAVAGIASSIPTVAANVTDITNFSDVYLGPKATAPTLRNDGSALQKGDLYFDTVSSKQLTYTGSSWVGGTGDMLAANNLSDLASRQTALNNLAATAADISFLQSSSGGAVSSTVEAKLRGWVRTSDFGVSSSASAADNLANWKKAVAATPVGGTLYDPDDAGAVKVVDTTGGLTAAILIDKQITIHIAGHLKANYSANEANPAYMFKVTSDDVRFEGSGTLEGDGTLNVASDGGVSSIYPGLVYVLAANEFRFTGIKIFRHPKIGIHLVNSKRAIISTCEIQGGPASFEFSFSPPSYTVANPGYIGSYYCGIVASGGGDHTFDKVHFTLDPDGGRTVQGIFSSGTYGNSNGNKTVHCIAYAPWEKLLYGYGDDQVISGNSVFGSGASSSDTHTDAIRVWGSFNTVTGNRIDGCRSGVQVLDGAQNLIANNVITRCRQSAINIQHFTDGYTGGISFNQVIGNTLTWDALSSECRFGIRVSSNTLQDATGIKISENIISGFGSTDGLDYAIDLMALSPRVLTGCSVKNNHLQSCKYGIRLDRSTGGAVSGNTFNSILTGSAIMIKAGTNNEISGNSGVLVGNYFLALDSVLPGSNHRFIGNKCTGANNIGIANFTFGLNAISARDNQWTAAALIGEATLAANTLTTITHGGVASHASIILIPTSQLFGALWATAGFYASPSGNNIAVRTANGAAAAGTETFRYEVIQ